MEKHKNIKNPNYRKFLDEGIISILKEKTIDLILSNIKHKSQTEAQALVMTLYLTGARPVEVLHIKAKDVGKDGRYITIKLKGFKRGLPRTFYLRSSHKYAIFIYNFAINIFLERYLFYSFKGIYKRIRANKKGEIIEREEFSQKLYYHIKKWTEDIDIGEITPYYFRHNRFSDLTMKGINDNEIKTLKGCRSYESIAPYQHMSTRNLKRIARKLE